MKGLLGSWMLMGLASGMIFCGEVRAAAPLNVVGICETCCAESDAEEDEITPWRNNCYDECRDLACSRDTCRKDFSVAVKCYEPNME